MSQITLHDKANYRICIQGVLDKSWLMTLGDWQVQNTAEETTISGKVLDQADLFGVLNYLYGLGVPLIAVELIRNDGEK